MIRKFVLALLVGGLVAQPLVAQQTGRITGRVTDGTTLQPIPNASVFIEGTGIGTLTNNSGAFLLNQVPVGTVQVTAGLIGYAPVTLQATVQADEAVVLDFALQAQAVVLEEIVATGYGTQRRVAITGSIATVQADEANVGVTTSANDLIQGRVAGLTFTQNNGEPGAGQQIRIRGGTSISASNEPLYVIDGVPIQNVATEADGIGIGGSAALARNPLSLLNPNDIESISVLKDASASAIYGSRAANGVVLITTKQGQAGAVRIEYDGYASLASAAQSLDVLNGEQYRNFIQEQVNLGNLSQDRLTGLGSSNTNWEDELTRNAWTQNHNLSFSGGTESTRYRASLNYMDQEGVVRSSGFERIQGRLNGQYSAFGDRLRLGLNLTTSRKEDDFLPYQNEGGFEGGVFQNMTVFNPTRPVVLTDPDTGEDVFYEIGTGRQSVRNPVALAEQIEDFATTTRTLGNVTGTLGIFDNLTGQVILGVDASSSVRRTYFPAVNPVGAEFNGLARQVSRDTEAVTLQTLLTFSQNLFESHQLEVVGGYEYNDYSIDQFGAEGRDFVTDLFSYNNLGGASVIQRPFSYSEDSRLVSFFGRANYNWNDRYFLTGVLRYDGSSRFGAGEKWALFPAISGSWRISEEDFMQGSRFSDLRLRVGYGLQGNQAVPPYASLITLEPNDGAAYVFGNSRVTGVAPNRNPNPALKWEETSQLNLALDFGLWDNTFSGTVEFYNKTTTDLLLEVAVAQPALVPTRLENIGEVNNKGLEVTLDALAVNRPNLQVDAGVVFTLERNEVVDLGGRSFISTGGVSGQGQTGQNSQRILPGYALGTFFGPEFVGINANGEQLFNEYSVQRDENGNEVSRELIGQTTSPSGDDFVVIGDANPDFSVGFRSGMTWGNLDASMLLRWEQGRDVFNNTALVYSTKGNALQDKNFLASALDDETGITQPAIFSDRWVEDGSFLRMQNITVGYSFDLPQWEGRQARAYLSADNLFLLSDYSGYDPEAHTEIGLASRGIDYLSYPRARTFTIGLRVGA